VLCEQPTHLRVLTKHSLGLRGTQNYVIVRHATSLLSPASGSDACFVANGVTWVRLLLLASGRPKQKRSVLGCTALSYRTCWIDPLGKKERAVHLPLLPARGLGRRVVRVCELGGFADLPLVEGELIEVGGCSVGVKVDGGFDVLVFEEGIAVERDERG